MSNDLVMLTGDPSNGGTRAPVNAEATQPPTGVPANGGSLTVADVTSPLGANVTSTWPGEHEVWVFSPDGTAGDFVLGFGVEEDFADEGCGELTRNWSTYAY